MAITVDAEVCSPAVPPAFIDSDWHDLPEGWLDKAISAIRYLSPPSAKANNPLGETNHAAYLHLFGSKMYATNKEHLIEYEIGQRDLGDAALLASEIKLLKSFGAAPCAACTSGDRICFRFDSGELYETQHRSFRDRYAVTLKDYWKFDRKTSLDIGDWKGSFLDQLGYLKNTDLIEVNPDGFIGSEPSNSAKVHVAAKTGCAEQRWFTASTLYEAVSIADGMDFTQEHACYSHANGRGLLTARSNRPSQPDAEPNYQPKASK